MKQSGEEGERKGKEREREIEQSGEEGKRIGKEIERERAREKERAICYNNLKGRESCRKLCL